MKPEDTSGSNTQAYDASAQLMALLDATVDAIIIINHKGSIEVFNQAAESMFGYQASEVINRNISLLMPSPYKNEHDQYIQHYLQSKQPKIIGIGREVKGLKKNGQEFPIELSVGEVKHASHKQFIGIIRDITDRVKVQATLAENRERLAQFTRLSTMGEMAAGIAHEINQPLTAITSYSQACRNYLEQYQPIEKNSALDKVSGALNKISAQTHRASEVINRLRNFVKKGHVTSESVDLHTLIEHTIKLAEVDTRLLEHGVHMHLTHTPEPMVKVDYIQIQQVLFNLLNNAIDALQGSPSQPIHIRSRWVDKQHIEVSVLDYGKGVQPEQESSLFQPFFTTKKSGMGVGLSISQSIIEAHGGKLSFSNGVPSGSVFTLTLPTINSQIQATP